MSLEVTVREGPGSIEVFLAGLLDPDLLARMTQAMGAVACPEKTTIFNLDEIRLCGRPEAGLLARAFDARAAWTGRVMLVCRDCNVAEGLRCWGLPSDIPLFRDTQAARWSAQNTGLAQPGA